MTFLKFTGSISRIDLNPYSSVLISVIEGILPPVIIKTMHCTDRVYLSSPFTWNAFAVPKNLNGSDVFYHRFGNGIPGHILMTSTIFQRIFHIARFNFLHCKPSNHLSDCVARNLFDRILSLWGWDKYVGWSTQGCGYLTAVLVAWWSSGQVRIPRWSSNVTRWLSSKLDVTTDVADPPPPLIESAIQRHTFENRLI